MVDNHTVISPVEDKMGYDVLHGKLSETWKGCYDRSILRLNHSCNLIPYYMYIYITYIYMFYGIQDPRPYIHITVYTDPYPVPHETTNSVYL